MYDNQKKKVRGANRKANSIIKKLELDTMHFPNNLENKSYFHFHIPSSQDFINGAKTPNYVREQVTQAMVDCTNHLYHMKPKDIPFCKIVVVFDFADLFDSQIVIFLDEEYYKSFFIRDTDSQRWNLLDKECQALKQWNIKIPEHFSLRGYSEQISEDTYNYSGELWFIGELE
ncbi:MAG: hypothetical protein K0Q99_1876 [Clostridia bacterium]|jgi:hypothetical protein|nr:hypothetical protein [Clostridia bacterium]